MRFRRFQIPLIPPLLKGEAKIAAALGGSRFIGPFEGFIQLASGFAGGNLTEVVPYDYRDITPPLYHLPGGCSRPADVAEEWWWPGQAGALERHRAGRTRTRHAFPHA